LGDNPYGEQTAANTSTTWLDDQKKVDLDLDGLVEFAKNLITIKDNLDSHTGYLSLLGELPMDAWDGTVLGEAAYVQQEMLANYGELRQYLSYLSIALNNIGMAAQTVADIYGSTDGWSAASLDAVNFAFGDKDAPRPDGLPPQIGKTFWDAYFEAQAAGGTAPPANDPGWRDQEKPRTNADGSVTYTATGPNGQVKEITTFSIPGTGVTVTTTTIKGANGKVLSTTSERTTTYTEGSTVVTRTSTTDGGGRITGSREERTTYAEGSGDVVAESKVNYDATGAETSATTTTTASDGTQTTTTTNNGEVVRQIEVGPQTERGGFSPESPAKDAQDEIKQHDYGI
jgi:hypothetical protein